MVRSTAAKSIDESIARSEVPWHKYRTVRSQQVVEALQDAGYEQVEAYNINSRAIRVRVVDPRFAGLSKGERIALMDDVLKALPEEIELDITMIVPITREEFGNPSVESWILHGNFDFENPAKSVL